MSADKDLINNLGNRYGEVYTNNSTFYYDEISRSYSSGIDAPDASSNLLRVYSRNHLHSQGSLRVRSSPSSPCRLSTIQCMTHMHKKWSVYPKVDISSSGLELPVTENCTKSCDQVDFPNSNQLTISSTSSRNASLKDLQSKTNEHVFQVNKDLYPNCVSINESINSESEKTTPVLVEHQNTENLTISYENSDADLKSRNLALFNNKLSSNPINFKKVLRDRYLSSQRISQSKKSSTISSTLSHQNISSNKSPSVVTNEKSQSELEDDNFRFIQDSERKSQQGQSMIFGTKLTHDDFRTRNALSLDLINLTMPRKYRIRSNNSTVSSISGMESESDPFSPASTEICSPLLKLNIPYRNYSNKDSESLAHNLIPSSSLSALSPTTKIDDFHSKSQESMSVQRFFPDTMKISDFNFTKTLKSDAHSDRNVRNHLMLPDFISNRPNSKSAPNSIEIVSLSPKNNEAVTSSPKLSTESSLYSSSFDKTGLKRISNSRSMDHISSFLSKENDSFISENIDTDSWDNSKLDMPVQIDSIVVSKSPNSRSMTKKVPVLPTSANQRQCDICGRNFNRSDMLARHMRVHTGHKPFECSICGQSFSRSDHLSTHLRIHSGEKPYRCSICSYSACRRDMITRHLRVHKRKGDILTESSSSLVVNVNKQKVANTKRYPKVKSQNSLNLDPDNYNDMKQTVSSLYRSRSYTDADECNNYNDHNASLTSVSPNETPHVTSRTFPNISISISQPTPRSSFSIPMETQNY